jgi:hypothetical protein
VAADTAPVSLVEVWTPLGTVPVPVRGDTRAAAGRVIGLGSYGGLAVQLRGRVGLGGSWRRVEPCSRTAALRCDPPLIPKLEPEVSLKAAARGTLLGRIHVDVDYDHEREGSAADGVRLSYAGRPGEALRRVEMGTVALAAPPSRFVAAGVPPAGAGVLATFAAGPVEVQGLLARHGSDVSRREFRRSLGGGGFGQEAETALDDVAYAAGQFFFLFDPAEIRGYPHLDIRALAAGMAPAELVPRAGVRLYRYTGSVPAQDGSTVLLRATARGGAEEAVTGYFRLLVPGTDYHLHASGHWVALRSRLGEDEALAAAYATAAGTEVGDPGAAAVGAPREARLIKGPRTTHRPGGATWPLEMRHVYPLSASDDVDAASVRAVISRGEPGGGDLSRPHPAGGAPVSYLRLFGLDDAAPADRVDEARLFHPAREGLGGVLHGSYVVFGTLRPFAAPPPGARLDAEQAARALGEAANPAVYEAAEERERLAAARFRLGFTYRTQGGRASRAVFPLGSAAVREGSERVYLGGRQLRRGIDYEVLYDVGEVHLRDPGALAALGSDSELRVTFHELTPFQDDPTYAAGFRARLPLGNGGELAVVGMGQGERSRLRRPPLGAEPHSMLSGGVVASRAWDAPWLTRALDALPGVNDSTRSELRLAADLALSAPRGGGADAAYLDDFEGGNEIQLPLLRQAWRLGSAPAGRFASATLPAELDARSAGRLAWQHDVRDAAGRVAGGVRTAEVDTLLRVTRGGRLTGALHLTLERGAGAGPAWRSITTVLSPTGRDLRDHAYLEFYARGGGAGDALVVELGTVGEDALALDDAGNTRGTDAEGRAWGSGVLDREWDPAREAWTAAHDRRGLWAATCRSEPGGSFAEGDARANCTRDNGVQDTEDLDGDGVLDTAEATSAFVVELGDPASPYLLRDTARTGTAFRLYRVPLHAAAGADLRAVPHLRLTAATASGMRLAIARMRLVGAAWQKRSASGTARGLVGGDTLAPGRLEVDHVGRLSADDGYVSPPGIGDRVQDPGDGSAALEAVEYSEKSLRLRYTGVGAGDRAEAVLPLPRAPRSFLPYREIRLWALARHGRWGSGAEEMFVRVGNGSGDHYLFRARLPGAVRPHAPADWGAEIVVDLARWRRLRAEAEALPREDEPGRAPRVVWDADSTYAVVLTERGRAPNLAAVREISVGVWNRGASPADGELWVDDVRLAGAERRPGAAGQALLSVRGGGLLQGQVAYTRESAHHRELGGSPDYQGEAGLSVDATVQAGRLLPARWGVSAPIRFRHTGAHSDPAYLPQTDLDVELLPRVRLPRQRTTGVAVDVHRTLPSRGALGRVLLDPLRLALDWAGGSQQAAHLGGRRGALHGVLAYELRPGARSLALPSTPLRLRWTPSLVSLSHTLSDAWAEQTTYLAGDSAQPPVRSATRELLREAAVGFRPLGTLGLDVALRSTRDLAAPDSAAGRRVLGAEAHRTVATQLAWTPRVAAWASAEAHARGSFQLDGLLTGTDPAAGRVRSFGGRRDLDARVRLDPRALAGDSAGGIAAVLRAAGPVELGLGRTLQTRFDRASSSPSLGLQLGWAPESGYRSVQGDSASAASALTQVSARSSYALPGALSLGMAYEARRTETFGARSALVERETSWPDLSVEWAPSALPAPLRLFWRSVSVSSGYRRRATRRDDPSAGQAHGTTAGAAPLRVTAVWAGGVSTSYQAEWRWDAASSPTARVENAGADQGLTLAGSMPFPRALAGGRLTAPLTLSLGMRQSERRECRPAEGVAGCVAGGEFAWYRDRAAHLQAETRAAGVTLGVQADYGDRRSRVGERNGQSHLRVGIFAQLEVGQR